MVLYKWQKECLEEWEKNRCRGIINVITGGGKTVLALSAARRLADQFPDLRVRIVVPTIPLAEQWKQALISSGNNEADYPGFYGGTRKDSTDCRYMIYIINSARDVLSRHIRADLAEGRHVLLICDECHHYQSKENSRIFDFLTPEMQDSRQYFSLGLSATPFPEGENSLLEQKVGKVICRYGFEVAVQDGVISPFFVSRVAADFSKTERDIYDDLCYEISIAANKMLKEHPELKRLEDRAFLRGVQKLAAAADYDPSEPAACFLLLCYQRKEVSVLAKERIDCCIRLIDALLKQERILIFCERIEQTETAAQAIRREFGNNICATYHSRMSREARNRNLACFRERSARILVSCRCLDEGIDVPDATTGIVLSSSSAERQRVQRLGRVIRRAPGKNAACLYYIYIRESADDRTFLPEFERCRSFDLEYDAVEQCFRNDFYEYAGNEFLNRIKTKKLGIRETEEIRRCLLEGLPRADYLMDREIQKQNAALAKNRKEKNYWIVMQNIGRYFQGKGESGT